MESFLPAISPGRQGLGGPRDVRTLPANEFPFLRMGMSPQCGVSVPQVHQLLLVKKKKTKNAPISAKSATEAERLPLECLEEIP